MRPIVFISRNGIAQPECSCTDDCRGNNCGGIPVEPEAAFDERRRLAFQCLSCDLWWPWECGAADDLPDLCDECWSESAPIAAREVHVDGPG